MTSIRIVRSWDSALRPAIALCPLALVLALGLTACRDTEPISASQQKTSIPGCTEGPPVYCADVGVGVRQETPMPAPPVNQVFQDPDFGSRMVRVTDASGPAGAHVAGSSFPTNAAGEANEWSKFDPSFGPHGGYHFYVGTSGGNFGGGSVFFTLDPVTLQVAPYCGHLPDCRLPSGGNFSFVNPNLIFGHFARSARHIDEMNLATGKESTIYDSSDCPNIPPIEDGYRGFVTGSGDDTKFADYAGGKTQGSGTVVTYYDRTAERCYWYDTATGTTGGTGMATTAVDGGLVAPPGLPALSAGAGDLEPGDYYVKLTVSSKMNPDAGETTPSSESHIRLSSRGGIAVAAPAVNNIYRHPIAGYSVYIGTAPGREMRQAALRPPDSGYIQTSRLLNGAPPPQQSRAGYNIHAAWLSLDGKAVRVDNQQGITTFVWTPGSTHLSACTLGPPRDGISGYCGGHWVFGYSHIINSGGPGPDTSLLLRPASDLNHLTQLIAPEKYPVRPDEDAHWSWNNADPSDSAPVCGAFNQGRHNLKGDGTENAATNPLLNIKQAWDREIVCVATTGPSRVWRFAHHRATGACNDGDNGGSCFAAIAIGNVSQDGKFYLFGSDWEWSLGDRQGGRGCPSSGTCRVDSFIVELK
jgi:hypothetical protein